MKENLNNKICIVGAGPSGMSAAWFLQKKGYTDITVLERLDRVGGKCNSPKFNGKYYEMGAGIGLPTYHETFQLMKEIEMDYFKPVVTGATYDCNTGDVLPTIAPEDIHILKSQIRRLQTLIETKYPDIKKPGHENVHVDLMETFKDFCIKNELSLILKAWINPYTAFGYGYFDLVPAAYVLQYLDIPTMQGFMSRDFISWKDGTESLWHKLATKLNKKARLCTNIKKVIRTENKVYVYTEFGKEAYDKIIFTSPLQDLSNYVDTTEEEANLFSKITYMDYKVFACIVDKAPHANGYIPGNMVANRSGHVMFFYNKLDEDNNIITFYTFGDGNERVTTEDCRRYLEEDLKLLGIDLKDVVMHKSWRYFPHVNSDQMKHGWYNKVEKLQGEKNTFFAGEVMSFSDIEECVCYSKHLVNRFF